jgi:hypothetical protein
MTKAVNEALGSSARLAPGYEPPPRASYYLSLSEDTNHELTQALNDIKAIQTSSAKISSDSRLMKSLDGAGVPVTGQPATTGEGKGAHIQRHASRELVPNTDNTQEQGLCTPAGLGLQRTQQTFGDGYAAVQITTQQSDRLLSMRVESGPSEGERRDCGSNSSVTVGRNRYESY